LSDSSKRPGTSRDISELKARLGLKKGGAPVPAAKNGGQGVVPPPGVNLPAPPGVATAPAGPVVPSAKDDPFGAMNAMAQIGTMQRAPEIVIVNDGRPVEHVGASKRTGTIVKYVVIGLVPLAIGIAIGQIAKEAKFYNAGISDAKKILSAKDNGVKDVKKKVVELQTALEGAAKNGFTPDKALTATLGTLVGKLEVKSDAVFRAKQNALNAELSGQILNFYAGVAEVRSMLTDHVKTATLEDVTLAEARKAADGAKGTGYLQGFGSYRYGVVIMAPSETDPGVTFGAKLVELGPPYCADGTQSATFECPNNAYSEGIPYRPDAGGQNWLKGVPQTAGASAEAKKVIPLLTSGIADGFVQGGKPGASEVLYVRRLEALKARVDELIKTGNSVETKLTPKTKEGDKFTFFL
jgi:hypothetical protein